MAATTTVAMTVRILLTIPETAAALGVSRSVVYELLLAGALPSVKIGRSRRVPVSALHEYVALSLHTQHSLEGR